MTGDRALDSPIAIVGMGCRFPGGIDSADELWRAVLGRVDAIGDLPTDRFDAAALGDRIANRRGGFIDGIDEIDAGFFGLSPREAERLDPQHRLLLETAWEAVEDAGIPDRDLAGSNAGVFVGLWRNDYEARVMAEPTSIDFHMTTGTGRYSASGRLSYLFDLSGPSLTIDTHCSSSLVAVHLAVESLRRGECDLALAGGANVILDPAITIAYTRSKMLAPDGRCKFGDASADGYVRSEGAGVVALRRLSDAVAAGDRIHAVIRGSAVTNDGRSSGSLAAPGRGGQAEMLRRAHERAGVDAGSIQYVEAHGTGTATGDPVELGAIGEVLGAGRSADQPCLVGSVKSNIGHTEAAAGVAGLIKAALAVREGEIPASLHVTAPHPAVPWSELRVSVVREHRSWPTVDGPRRAGVSSFGITGTNAHVVVEEPPAPTAEPEPVTGPVILPVSAASPDGLQAVARLMADHVAAAPPSELAAISAAACRRRSHLGHRLAVVGSSTDEIVGGLLAWSDDEPLPARVAIGTPRPDATPRVGFVFSGQGPQWWGMGRELMTSSEAFRSVIERCDRSLRAHVSWSLSEELARDEATSRLAATEVAQPALFAVQVGLHAVLGEFGIRPDAVVGHSVGEIAAAHVAGVLDLETAVAVVARRGQLMQAATGAGAMASVGLSSDEIVSRLAGHPDVAVAAMNAPSSTVVAGPTGALDAFLTELGEQADVTRLPVDYAFHHPTMAPHGAALERELAGVAGQQAGITFVSTVTGAVEDGTAVDASHWARGVVQPVRFADAVQALLGQGVDALVEIGPHPVLRAALAATARAEAPDDPVAIIGSLRRGGPERADLLSTVADLHVIGVAIDWASVAASRGVVDLPTYPWQRRRHWYEPSTDPRGSETGQGNTSPIDDGPGNGAGFELADRFRAAPTAAMGTGILQAQVRGELAAVLRLSPAEIDPAAPFKAMGLDSLLSVELQGRLEARTGLALDSATAFNHPTVDALAAHLADQLSGSADRPAATPPAPLSTGEAGPGFAGTEGLAEGDLDALLADELAAVDDLLNDGGSPR